MTMVTYKDYSNDLAHFINKHSIKSELISVNTSGYEGGVYRKEYMFEDGASFYEVNRNIKGEANAETVGLKFKVKVDLIEHEYWSTDDSKSKYWYEKA